MAWTNKIHVWTNCWAWTTTQTSGTTHLNSNTQSNSAGLWCRYTTQVGGMTRMDGTTLVEGQGGEPNEQSNLADEQNILDVEM